MTRASLAPMEADIVELLEQFAPVSLGELDDRAGLLRRVDNKYAVERQAFLELAAALKDDHEVLEIDGSRAFAYRTTYFDSPDLRCFTDHVDGHLPRFKARTRLYRDSDQCVFEVKLKNRDDETDKRQIDYPAEDRERLTDQAKRCLSQALADAAIDSPDELAPRLHTAFDRITLAARGGSERITCDLGVRLSSPDHRTADLRRDLVLVETKTEHGDGPADGVLRGLGVQPVSLSKYRVGTSLVGHAPTNRPQPGSELFATAQVPPL